MGLVLEFNELESGAQVGVQTTDRGIISGVAVPQSSGSGGFQVVTVDGATDMIFDGVGGVGKTQIFPMTIVVAPGANSAGVTFKLGTPGVSSGWLVAFDIEGFDPGEVTITDEDDAPLTIVDATSTGSGFNKIPYPVCYYNGGWFLLRSDIHVS